MSTSLTKQEEKTPVFDHPPSHEPKICPGYIRIALSELKIQQKMAFPLIAMNLTWFAKIAITTAFLGHLGELELAGGSLGFTFANVTGFTVLNGLCSAMDPICGQAYGAKNFKLLHKTLTMAIMLLLLITLPISLLWLNVDKILVHLGQEKEISIVAKNYLFYLLPDLVITSFLCPLKSFLSSQSLIVPIMISSSISTALHVPINIFLSRVKGLEGIAMGFWITDLNFAILLVIYVLIVDTKSGKWKEGGWLEQEANDWIELLKLCVPCCLTTCLEWWCVEVLILLTGHLKNAKQGLGVLTIVLNFDYLVYSVMLSLATCASIRVSNELGANQVRSAYESVYVSIALSIALGSIGGATTLLMRKIWGNLFSHDKGIIKNVKKMMVIMAMVELVNAPLTVSGGVVRGTARPSLALYANVGGFYFLALPLSVILAFKFGFGLSGLLIGFLVGMVTCLVFLLTFIAKINWAEEARKAQIRSCEAMNTDVVVGRQIVV